MSHVVSRPAAGVAAPGPSPRPVSLKLCGATGALGSLCVFLGVTQAGSPFALKSSGAWFFGIAAHPPSPGVSSDPRFLTVMLAYAGIALLLASWLELVRTLRRRPEVPMVRLVGILVAWGVPVLVAPPLFSRDVYSYAAQGQMVTQGINPYLHGPVALGHGRFLDLVDPLWRHSAAPYGPAWERLSGWIVQLARHDVLASIAGFRLVALLGLVLIAWGVPSLARSVGCHGTTAFALGVLNPLVLLVLLGGAHNDALMLGLLVAGCALARRNHAFVGIVLCAGAAEVKVPALIGAAFIGWWWSEGEPNRRRRIPGVAAGVGIAAGLMALISALCGLGWHWLSGLSDPGVVVSWLDPATATGLALGHGAGGLGYGGHLTAFVQAARGVGLGLAAVISLGLLLRSKRAGALQALGWSLLAFVVLGPVVWPWYETWGFVFLAIGATGWTLQILLALSALACFADVPSARLLGAANPALTIIGWCILLGAVAAYGYFRLMPCVGSPQSLLARQLR